ncbi:hypothetical protein U0070_006093 [Myodes glareolus]|uniref:Uncharacterized protein n=1 Tax=Myodes glareolus TaxID=447135 RepID=A0AAW0IAU1_MYOGA
MPHQQETPQKTDSSDRYFEEHDKYQQAMLPGGLSQQAPKTHVMSEEERRLGVYGLGTAVFNHKVTQLITRKQMQMPMAMI